MNPPIGPRHDGPPPPPPKRGRKAATQWVKAGLILVVIIFVLPAVLPRVLIPLLEGGLIGGSQANQELIEALRSLQQSHAGMVESWRRLVGGGAS